MPKLIYPFHKDYVLRKKEIKTIPLSVDTIITFDATTFEEQIVVVRNELNLDDITSFKIAQEVYFDTKDYTFKNRLLAIASGRRIYNRSGEILYERFYFWIVYEDDFLKWLD